MNSLTKVNRISLISKSSFSLISGTHFINNRLNSFNNNLNSISSYRCYSNSNSFYNNNNSGRELNSIITQCNKYNRLNSTTSAISSLKQQPSNKLKEIFNFDNLNRFNKHHPTSHTSSSKTSLYTNINNNNNNNNVIFKYNNNNNNHNSNNLNVGYRRQYFHSNLPNYFVFSKTLRLVLPFAMTGIRSWIRAGNSYLRFAFICALLFGTSGLYIFFNQEFAPVTGRARFIGVSTDEERDIADMGYNFVMEQYDEFFLPENNVLQNQVRMIAKRLVPHSGIELPWECHVINSPEVNAFVLPSGKIFVFTGLFEIVDTEDELAAVISHEIGHAIARHSAERMSLLKIGIVFLTITRGLIGDTISGNITTIITTKLLELNYSRMQEIEADIIGVEILKKAGFNVNAAIKVQEKLGQISDDGKEGKIAAMLSTHPKSSERVQKIKEWIEADRLKEIDQPVESFNSNNKSNTCKIFSPNQ